MISALLAAEWVAQRLRGDLPSEQRALVLKVGTGEGKSLVIGILALVLLKLHGKRVFVMEANMALLSRDVEEMRDLYRSFTVKDKDGNERAVTVSSNFADPDDAAVPMVDSDITYVVKGGLNAFYRQRVGKLPLANTVLILDEVDSLIVDGKPNSSYVCPDAERSAALADMFELCTSGRADSIPASRAKTMALAAVAKGQQLMRKNAYTRVVKDGGKVTYVEMDARGKPMVGFFSLACEFIGWHLEKQNPTDMSCFFVQSMPFMLTCFDALVGLSGSLGSAAEQAFMRRTYGAKALQTPPFLSTCQGLSKHLPQLVNNAVEVLSTPEAHASRIRELALDFRSRVPVVILANSEHDATRLFDAFSPADRVTGTVQLFFELTKEGRTPNYKQLVADATRPMELGGQTTWPVTLSDVFGGRGQDYRVIDDAVDCAGGILVVASAIAESEREWCQWLGRTARSDRRGQYAVILLDKAGALSRAAPRLVLGQGPVPGSLRLKADVIEQQLAQRDELTKKALAEQADEIVSGMRLHELCDRFWSAPGRRVYDRENWPSEEEELQTDLRTVLETTTVKQATVETVARAAVQLELAASAAAYKALSTYCKHGG
jgi:hypothetical protein